MKDAFKLAVELSRLGQHCSVCGLQFVLLSGDVAGCAVHGIREAREVQDKRGVLKCCKHCLCTDVQVSQWREANGDKLVETDEDQYFCPQCDSLCDGKPVGTLVLRPFKPTIDQLRHK